MHAVTILLVLLSHAGFWVGGREQTIELCWNIDAPMPAASVTWELSAAGVALQTQTTPVAASGATIRLTPPKVRAVTGAVFRYRVVDTATGREIATGQRNVQLHPDRAADLAALTADAPIVLLEGSEALSSLLKAAGSTFETADHLATLAATPRIVIVGEDRLKPDSADLAACQALAQGGASVLVLRQSAGVGVLPLETSERDVAGYVIDADHPLLRHLSAADWQTLVSASPRRVAILMPADVAALEIVHGPVESPAVTAAPLDALLVTQTLGKGRIVYCQLPLGEASRDARQQQLLVNLIEYARTTPQPTPPRSERVLAKNKAAAAAGETP